MTPNTRALEEIPPEGPPTPRAGAASAEATELLAILDDGEELDVEKLRKMREDRRQKKERERARDCTAPLQSWLEENLSRTS